MPSTTPEQARFMAACAHGAGYKSCPPQKVSTEFNQADKGTAMLSKAMRERSAERRVRKQFGGTMGAGMGAMGTALRQPPAGGGGYGAGPAYQTGNLAPGSPMGQPGYRPPANNFSIAQALQALRGAGGAAGAGNMAGWLGGGMQGAGGMGRAIPQGGTMNRGPIGPPGGGMMGGARPPANFGPPAGGSMSAPGMPMMGGAMPGMMGGVAGGARPPPTAGGFVGAGGMGGGLAGGISGALGGLRPGMPAATPTGPQPRQFGDEAFFGQLAQNNPGMGAQMPAYRGPIGAGQMFQRGGGVRPPGLMPGSPTGAPMGSPLPMARPPVSGLSSLIGGAMAGRHAGFPGPRRPRVPLPGQLRNINQPINRIRGPVI